MEINLFGGKVFINKVLLISLIIIIASALGVTGYALSKSNSGIIIEKNDSFDQGKAEKQINTGENNQEWVGKGSESEEKKEMIKVYIVGCVKSPGLVEIKKDDVIFDAINAAGGATDEADLENINLAYKIKENVMIRIKSKKETQTIQAQPENSSNTRSQTEMGQGVEVVKNSMGAVASEVPQNEQEAVININTASAEQLDTLPGIGPETAKDIIAYREKNGDFKKPEDIMKVPGIKESKYSKIKDRITN